jgi:hypothetical protein
MQPERSLINHGAAHLGISLTAGWLMQSNAPTEKEIGDSIKDRGWSVEGGMGIGVAYNNNEENRDTLEIGFTTPNFSASYTQMYDVTDAMDAAYWRVTR